MAKKGHASPEAKKAMELFHSGKARSLKEAWAKIRGRGGGTHHSMKKAESHSRREGLGAAYLNAKVGQELVSPVIDQAMASPSTFFTKSSAMAIKDKVVSLPYAENVATGLADRWLDKKLGQAAALSRGSVTALAPEVIAGAEVVSQLRAGGGGPGSVRNANQALNRMTTAYRPAQNDWNPSDALFVRYQGAKRVGQALRYIGNRTRLGQRVLAPVKKALSHVGLTW